MPDSESFTANDLAVRLSETEDVWLAVVDGKDRCSATNQMILLKEKASVGDLQVLKDALQAMKDKL